MTRLSHSTLKMLTGISHEWINKTIGIPIPDYPFLKEGKEAHRIIQDHVSGVRKRKALESIQVEFPVVERVDFDEKCKFLFKTHRDFEIIGFVDGLDPKNKRILEIKTSTNGWSIQRFRDSMQRKLYALAFPDYEEAYLITGSKDPKVWEKEPPKIFSMKLTDKDRKEAEAWISRGIKILDRGEFRGGLDDRGRCTGCFWNMERFRSLANCHFL